MTTNAELEAAAAQAIGLKPWIDDRLAADVVMVETRRWSPLTNLADAWELHQGLRATGLDVEIAWTYLGADKTARGASCILNDTDTFRHVNATGATDAEALVRAAAGLGK